MPEMKSNFTVNSNARESAYWDGHSWTPLPDMNAAHNFGHAVVALKNQVWIIAGSTVVKKVPRVAIFGGHQGANIGSGE